MDVFDKFVLTGQSVSVGEAVVRKYKPVSESNRHIVIHIFSSDRDDREVMVAKMGFPWLNSYLTELLFFQFITDPDVEMCGTLSLSLETWPPASECNQRHLVDREIQAKMSFGDTEIKASAIDVKTNQTVRAFVDFLNESNPKYETRL